MISFKMNETKGTSKFGCEFCNRTFVREKTMLTHICEYRRRWLDKEKKGNVLGLQAWIQFYSKTTTSKKKNKTYEEFMKSPYYIPFVKFGNYCVDINAINVSRYVDWLIRFNIRIDDWTSDQTYNRFLCDYLKSEDAFDSIKRGIEYCIKISEDEKVKASDVLRYVNENKICQAITNGKISPWMLYQSKSGVEFMDKLNDGQIKFIFDYIDPEYWALKFKQNSSTANEIKSLLSQAGY